MKKKRKGKNKGKGGRHDHSGVLSGIEPERETWSDIRNRIIYDSAEWPLMALRHLIGDGSTLPDNFLSADYLSIDTHDLQRQEKALRQKIAMFWRPLRARFERAVLNGDADWFKRQSQAVSSKQSQEKIQFNAKVVHLLEMAMWSTHATHGVKHKLPDGETIMEGIEDLTLTPAGKFTDAMASDIYDALEKDKKDGVLYVGGCPFTSKESAMEAIHDLAKKLKFALRKQH